MLYINNKVTNGRLIWIELLHNILFIPKNKQFKVFLFNHVLIITLGTSTYSMQHLTAKHKNRSLAIVIRPNE